MLSLLCIVSTVSIVNAQYPSCTDTDFKAPCIGDDGIVLYYCNDSRADTLKGCLPSDKPEEDTANGQKQLQEQQSRQQPSDIELWNKETNNMEVAPGSVRIMASVQVLGDEQFNEKGQVCIERKDNGDSACQKGIELRGDEMTFVPFVIPTKDDGEGVWLPEGKEFQICVHLSTKEGHLENCEPAKNDGAGADVIGVYIAIMPDMQTTPLTEMPTMNMSSMDMK